MSNKHGRWFPAANQWYMARNETDRYMFRHNLGNVYWVYSYSTGRNVFAGSLNECRHWMNKHCYSHDEYNRRRL